MRVSPPSIPCMKTQNYILVQSHLFPATLGPLTQMELRSEARTRKKCYGLSITIRLVLAPHTEAPIESVSYFPCEYWTSTKCFEKLGMFLGETFQEAACKGRKTIAWQSKECSFKTKIVMRLFVKASSKGVKTHCSRLSFSWPEMLHNNRINTAANIICIWKRHSIMDFMRMNA